MATLVLMVMVMRGLMLMAGIVIGGGAVSGPRLRIAVPTVNNWHKFLRIPGRPLMWKASPSIHALLETL